MVFKSETYGNVTEEEMFDILEEKLTGRNDYTIHVGSDSQSYGQTNLVTVILVRWHKNGGFFFSHKQRIKRIENLQHKIQTETDASIKLGTRLKDELIDREMLNSEVSIDLDIGRNGPTKQLIKPIVGWVLGMGFSYNIKPESYAASCVADRISK